MVTMKRRDSNKANEPFFIIEESPEVTTRNIANSSSRDSSVGMA